MPSPVESNLIFSLAAISKVCVEALITDTPPIEEKVISLELSVSVKVKTGVAFEIVISP